MHPRPASLLVALLGTLFGPLGWAVQATAPHAEPGAQRSAAACREWAVRLPGTSAPACQALGLQDVGARSVQGRPLWVRDVLPGLGTPVGGTHMPAAPLSAAPLRVLVVGAIHGDELSAGALALHWLALAQQPHATPRPVHWRFIPVLNPDGLLATPPRRTNAHGVDLNRNFPTAHWAREAPAYWAQRTRKDPRRWPGPVPLSEPESRFLHHNLQQWRPDLVVSIHAPYGVLDFDGPSAPPRRLGRLVLDQVGIYPGSLGNYAGVQQGVPVVTIELPSAVRIPLDAETRHMWQDLQRWMQERMGRRTGPQATARID